MANDLSEISNQAWQTAVERLHGCGVFADEERRFPSLPVLRNNLDRFEAVARSKGYAGGALEMGEIEQPREGVDFLIFDRETFGSVQSATAAWYKDYVDRWHGIVDNRVNDWIGRLNELRTTMEIWLPSGMSICDRAPTAMREELMRKFNVPPAKMPAFEILRGTDRVMRVQPKGLWVIGANGRVDLITKHASYILVDESEPSSGAANWNYYASTSQRIATQLDQAHFVSLLN
jgi:hypothetical protein